MQQIHPVPQFRRGDFTVLDGAWSFAEDPENRGEQEKWYCRLKEEKTITVPFACESRASGIGKERVAQHIWYQTTVNVAREKLQKSALLRFEGVDYAAKVWVNGTYVGCHEGGYTAFSFEISRLLVAGENTVTVKVSDSYSIENPRGKQRWLDRSYSCWYVPTTGIWKSVWLEFTGEVYLTRVKWTPCIFENCVKAEIFLNEYRPGCELEISVRLDGSERKNVTVKPDSAYIRLDIDMTSAAEEFQVRLWSPDDPALYDVFLLLRENGERADAVESYFGYRDFRTEKDSLLLNGVPVYEKLVLYQGYWQDTGLTAPSYEAVEHDLCNIKAMGFNGLRVHQKIESEYFLYLADKLGLFVWCEMPSPHLFNDNMKQKFVAEWSEILRQKYNHPSIVTWCPFNESWGIRGVLDNGQMQAFADSVYYLTRAYDGMRPIVGNDGWEQTKTDLLTVHNYEQNEHRLYLAYCDRENALSEREATRYQKMIFARGYRYEGQPVIVSEFGGLAFLNGLAENDWGYSAVATEDDFVKRFGELCTAIKKIGYISGYCYTQYSDVWQEKNGLVTMDRKMKVDPEKIKKINDEKI